VPRNLKTEERTKKPVRANALSLLGLGDVDLLTRSLERVANNSAISSTGDGTRTNMDNEFKPSGLNKHVLVPVNDEHLLARGGPLRSWLSKNADVIRKDPACWVG
jgi:hypothetical protein